MTFGEGSQYFRYPVVYFLGGKGMRVLIYWLFAILGLVLALTFYFENRATTYITSDGACQALTPKDDCY